LIFLTSVSVFSQDRLDPRLRKALPKALRSYMRSDSPEDRDRWALAVCAGGRPGLRWLKTKNAKRPKALEALADLSGRAARILGEDILDADPKVTPWDWYPNLLQVGEVLLVKRADGALAALRVLNDPYPGDGRLTFEWWIPKKDAATVAGGRRGKDRAVGSKASRPWRPQSGWTEYDYSLEFDGFRADLRFVGPLHLLIRLDGKTPVALTGSTSAKSVRLRGARAPRFLTQPPKSWLRVPGDLQAYLFRLLPGCSPLRLKPDEKKSFAHFESVQVTLRLQRGTGLPLVLVHLLEPDEAGLLPEHLPLLDRFLRVLVPDAVPSLLIMGGDAPAMEGNRFFGPGGWAPPTGKQVQLLRREFSEES